MRSSLRSLTLGQLGPKERLRLAPDSFRSRTSLRRLDRLALTRVSVGDRSGEGEKRGKEVVRESLGRLARKERREMVDRDDRERRSSSDSAVRDSQDQH
jgi:hypothetical protein